MRHVVVLCALAGALALAPAASSGGWASVGFAPLPDGTSAGSTWSPTIYVKQHGITPLAGLQPVVEVYTDAGEATKFLATETPEAGIYEADVVFPSQGDWRLVIHSGFGDSHVTYGPFAIEAPSVGGGDSREIPVTALGLVALGLAATALLGGLAVLLGRRTRSLTPAS